jgi:hypothetical protein
MNNRIMAGYAAFHPRSYETNPKPRQSLRFG